MVVANISFRTLLLPTPHTLPTPPLSDRGHFPCLDIRGNTSTRHLIVTHVCSSMIWGRSLTSGVLRGVNFPMDILIFREKTVEGNSSGGAGLHQTETWAELERGTVMTPGRGQEEEEEEGVTTEGLVGGAGTRRAAWLGGGRGPHPHHRGDGMPHPLNALGVIGGRGARKG